jgi:RNA polymerase sigma-70 factor (ECF subfamily)
MTAEREYALITAIQNGETSAYRLLYDAHVLSLFRFLKQFKRSDADVQELVQRAFIKAYDKLGTFNRQSAFKTWLFQIALNELRGDFRRASLIPFVEYDSVEEPVISGEEDRLEWNSTLRSAVDSLDDLKKCVFLLYEVEGYSHGEIADMLSIGESSSRTILTRTKQQLRTHLREHSRRP